MTTLYQANRMAFIDGRRIRPGEVFTLPPGIEPAAWMEPVGDAPDVPDSPPPKRRRRRTAKAADPAPDTLSAMAAEQADAGDHNPFGQDQE